MLARWAPFVRLPLRVVRALDLRVPAIETPGSALLIATFE